ncbi:MAG: DUF4282 domain-containing protein [Acidobacteria bacterium]|nr:DUF4282 domain-containing protein [Acidobacteriota bacterium]
MANNENSTFKTATQPGVGFDAGAFFSFRQMLSGEWMKIIYALGAVGITLWGLMIIMQGAQSNWGAGGIIILGLLTIAVGNILWRLACECCVLLFSLHAIVSATEGSSPRQLNTAPPVVQAASPSGGFAYSAPPPAPQAAAVATPQPFEQTARDRVCPQCGTWIRAAAAFCGSCGGRA